MNAKNDVNNGSEADSRRAIAELAYSYWEQGGRRDGTSEADWLRACETLQQGDDVELSCGQMISASEPPADTRADKQD